MRAGLFVLVLLMNAISVYSQWPSRDFRLTGNVLEETSYSIDSLSKHIYESIPEKFLNRDEVILRQYSDDCALSCTYGLSSGDIYGNWPELSNYLNEMIQLLLPEDFFLSKFNKVLLVRNGSMNAYVDASGIMYVNIGLLANLEDESSLAMVLAHELSHYYLNHMISEHLRSLEDFKYVANTSWGVEYRQRNSRINELQADSLALVWIDQAGFNVESAKSVFETFQLMEQNSVRKSSYQITFEESTHPLSKDRLLQISSYLKRKKNVNENVESDGRFYSFQEEARLETLIAHLDNFKYLDCIETAFKFHLLDPDNREYVYFILEGIRRQCFMYPIYWKYNFINSQYYQKVGKDHEGVKPELAGDLFDSYDAEVLGMTSKQLQRIQARFYWEGEKKFKTYLDAFLFYLEVGKLMGNDEVILTGGLGLKGEKADSLLNQYLALENIEQRYYAEVFKDSKNEGELNSKRLIVIDEVVGFVKSSYVELIVPIKDSSDFYIRSLLEDVKLKFPNDTVVYLPDIQSQNPAKYRDLRRIKNLSFNFLSGLFKKIDYGLLDPVIYRLMREYEVAEVCTINCQYIVYRKRAKSIEDYENNTELSMKDMLQVQKENRYFKLVSSGFKYSRSFQNRSYTSEGEVKIKSNKTGKEEYLNRLEKALSSPVYW